MCQLQSNLKKEEEEQEEEEEESSVAGKETLFVLTCLHVYRHFVLQLSTGEA